MGRPYTETAGRPVLRALAERLGVLSSYVDNGGVERWTSDETRVAALAAMGVDAADERVAQRALDELGTESRGGEVAAGRCVGYREKLGARRVFGVWANLYSLRGDRGLGVGDLTDLRALVGFAAEQGASFVGISPLHAHRNQSPDISPYCGLSRIFRNPIYLDVEAVPEFESCARAQELLASTQSEILALRAGARVDYASVADVQRPVLRALFEALARAEGRRASQFAEFRARDHGLVVDFAVFLALSEELGPDWRSWPGELRDPRSPAAQAYALEHAGEIDVHVFAQFELDRQLAAVAAAARDSGIELGLYQDLALGSAASGFDAWAFPGLFVEGVSLGAPPDAYAEAGQDWAIPPLDPRRVSDDDYRYWRLVLRAGMEHSGVLRIDHAMGLTRQFWVPHGRSASDGCYVEYPLRDLLRVLAQESRRHDCLIVGEDLGTVPAGFASKLAHSRALSSRVLLFERAHDGRFCAASSYSKRALVTANTHDHPTLSGWASGRDLEIRRELGLFETDADLAEARREREADLDRLRRRVGLGAGASAAELIENAYGFLGRTPCPLVGVSLDDLAGETDPVNIPGVPPDRYPSWTRKMTVPLAELARSSAARRAFAAVAAARRA